MRILAVLLLGLCISLCGWPVSVVVRDNRSNIRIRVIGLAVLMRRRRAVIMPTVGSVHEEMAGKHQPYKAVGQHGENRDSQNDAPDSEKKYL